MNPLLQAILVCLGFQAYHTFAETGQCHTPHLDNGVVDGSGDGGSFFKGKFRCNTGFTLSGPIMLKCRNGVWSGSIPVCSVFGCDPKNLPEFVNGRRQRVKGTRDSVFKYKCNRGFSLFGPKNVYCTKNGWKIDETPVCARVGCDEEELLGNGVPHGHKKSMFQGAAYKFYCESGCIMEGNSAVYCDGYSWNGTKPECLGSRLVCKARGGNPFPSLAFMIDGERVNAENKEMLEHGGYNAVHTFTVENHHANLDMSCIAENKMTSIPVASNHQTLSVKFGPGNIYLHGADMLTPGEVGYSCTSAESNPASEISVQITDQDGNDIAIEMTKPPQMKGNAGFASALQFKFQVLPHFRSVFIQCEANNGVGQASTGLAVHVMYPPSNVQITGPDHLLSVDDETEPNNIFTCNTDDSNPAADIDWVIETGGVVETIPEHSTDVETINQGHGWKKISTLHLPPQLTDGVKVHCVATNGDLGFSKKSDELEVDLLELPKEVSIIGQEILFLNSLTEFQCITQEGDTESTVSIHVSSLNGEPVSFQLESDNTISVTVQEPLEGVIVECFAENLAGSGPVQTKRVDIQYPQEAKVKDLSVELTGVEEGAELTEDIPIEVKCSVLAVPDLTAVKWYVDQKMVHGRSLVLDGHGNMVSTFRWWPVFGETRLECVPEVEGNIFAGSAAVSFEVVEGDYGYGEDFYLDDDYEEEYSEPIEEYIQEENLKVSEDSTTDKSVNSLNKVDSTESNDALTLDNYEEDEFASQESNLYEESLDNVNQKEGDHTLDNDQTVVNEDLFDATKQKQSFAIAEPGPAVLSHESDSNKHVSADLSRHKSLYSSSGRICSFNIIISTFISSISRLIC